MAKTTEEMIEVMNAYKNGKTIESTDSSSEDWGIATTPVWNWVKYDYRVKAEPKYRPYENTEEMIQDFCERFKVRPSNFGLPFIWVTDGEKSLITDYQDNEVCMGADYASMIRLFKDFTYIDGSPCGKLE